MRASKIRSLSKAVYLNIYPVVKNDERLAWENYTAFHHEWVNQSMSIHDMDYQTYNGPRPTPKDFEVWNVIHDDDEYYKEPPDAGSVGTARNASFYMPTWQSSPVIATYPPYNW